MASLPSEPGILPSQGDDLLSSLLNERHEISILIVASAALTAYEYLLTLSMEIEMFWVHPARWKWKWPRWHTVLFFLNRYSLIFGYIPQLLVAFHNDPEKLDICSYSTRYGQVYTVFTQTCIELLVIFRVWILYGKSRGALCIMLGFGFVEIGVAAWAILSPNKTATEHFLCYSLLDKEQAVKLAVAWGGAVLCDTLVFSMTVYRSIPWKRVAPHSRILETMLRDGSIYYVLMMICNAANILTFIYGKPLMRGSAIKITSSLSSIAASRLVFGLKKVEQSGLSRRSSTPPTRLVFALRSVG